MTACERVCALTDATAGIKNYRSTVFAHALIECCETGLLGGGDRSTEVRTGMFFDDPDERFVGVRLVGYNR